MQTDADTNIGKSRGGIKQRDVAVGWLGARSTAQVCYLAPNFRLAYDKL